MDNPLIFGYQLSGVKTLYMTRGMFGAAQCWMSAFFSEKSEEGILRDSKREVFQNVLPRKVYKGVI